ncbi:MAG: stage II sporulation protein R [Ruminococcaceae bacterium]|nr:stage II sporulation protein R [Oscillospiraceae bacterium]
MKKLLLAFIVFMSLILILVYFPVHGEEKIYDTVLRLHVIANSDSEEDQALKLKVRDAVIRQSEVLLDGCTTRSEAAEHIEAHRDSILFAAESVIRNEGYSYPVAVKLGLENYPEKSYDSCCFPAGEYLSLRVCIGEAEGENWWCVLFPPLCLSAAKTQKQSNEDAFVAVGLNKDQYGIITQTEKTTYKVRFKILEVFQGTFG